jgi:hypothetical protein
LWDVVLPELSGIDLAARLKEQAQPARSCSSRVKLRLASCLKAARGEGHDFEVLAKPIHPVKLLARIRDVDVSEAFQSKFVREHGEHNFAMVKSPRTKYVSHLHPWRVHQFLFKSRAPFSNFVRRWHQSRVCVHREQASIEAETIARPGNLSLSSSEQFPSKTARQADLSHRRTPNDRPGFQP